MSRRRKPREKQPATLWPVYEFRPDEAWLKKWSDWRGSAPPLYRYANGEWIKDDGEYDLAFAAIDHCAPLSLYVSMPYHAGIIWSWLTGPWWTDGPRGHPVYRGSMGPNPWHYMLRDGAKGWGSEWDRDNHENRKAGDSGMSFAAKHRSCANGRGVEFNLADPHIKAGLLRRRDTKEVVTFPSPAVCMYCGPMA